jgi:putative hydrolase of the HAD superfamily
VNLEAVLFDLDDTLYEQRQWLDGAWRAVARRAAHWAVDPTALDRALRRVAALGSDRGGIIDSALRLVGRDDVPVAPLLEVFRCHTPAHLDPYPGVDRLLERLAAQVPLGLVSDGYPAGQLAKLDALHLASHFSTVVLSDQLGRAHRKPDPLPFHLALHDLGVEPTQAVYIGDRPGKDVAGAVAAGLTAVRVRTGEWHNEPDDPRALASVPDLDAAVRLVSPSLRPRVRVAP